jgi:hypothetical protein
MLTEREDRTIDDQRVVVTETLNERSDDFFVIDLGVSYLIQRLAPDADVRVIHRRAPIGVGDETLSDRSTKCEDALTRDRARQIGSQDRDVVVDQREAGPQQRFVNALR